jgi:phosphoadenosine phosphosulfate reductase
MKIQKPSSHRGRAERAPCVTSSFQTECVVLVHRMVARRPEIPVLFLETGYHFPETIEYRDRISRDWKLNLINLEAKQSVADQEAQFGILNRTEPNRCCALRKVGPLFEGLANYDTWFTALRREQSPTRANLQPVEPFKLPIGKTLQNQPARRLDQSRCGLSEPLQHPALPLYDQGYTHRLPALHRPPVDPTIRAQPLAGTRKARVQITFKLNSRWPTCWVLWLRLQSE